MASGSGNSSSSAKAKGKAQSTRGAGETRKGGGGSSNSSAASSESQKTSQLWVPVLSVLAILASIAAWYYIELVVVERERPRESDIFIVSYPKSGNNWLRFLYGHLWLYSDEIALKTGKELDFVTVEKVIPDLEYGPNRLTYHTFEPPRAFKSHQPFAPEAVPGECRSTVGTMDDFQCACPNCPTQWHRILHLVRDGRDVMCSYYHFQKGLGTLPKDVDDFESYLRAASEGLVYPGFGWGAHVQSYLDLASNSSYDVLTIRYEDLHKDPEEVLTKIASWAHLEAPAAVLTKTISASSFKRMRAKEESAGLALFDKEHADRDTEWRLTRKGKVGGWQECFTTQESKDLWNRMAGDQMFSLGYVTTHQW